MKTKDLIQDQTYPTNESTTLKLPLSLQFVIFSNYYFTINGWSVFYFMIINLTILQNKIELSYIIVMLIPSFILSTLSIIISKKLLQRSNIILSAFHVIMATLLIDMLNSGTLSSLIGAELNTNELHWFIMSLVLLSLILSSGSLLVLILNKSLQFCYLNKDVYIKPWFIRNFGVTSIIASTPFVLFYVLFF